MPSVSFLAPSDTSARAGEGMETVGRSVARASYASLFNDVRKECKFYYDFVRELISNSYDGDAATIELLPLFLTTSAAQPLLSVLAIYDDGVGMDNVPRTADENDGLDTPPGCSIDAYCQLGYSTKTGRHTAGHKCKGSKQVFHKADAGFILVTRTARMPPGRVLLIDEDHISHSLLHTGGVDWRIVSRETAAAAIDARLRRLDRPSDVAPTSARLRSHVAAMEHGTIQIVLSRAAAFHERRLCDLDREQRTWPAPNRPSRLFHDDVELSTLYTVLRFHTRHGNAFHSADGHFCGMERDCRQHLGELGPVVTRRARLLLFTKKYPQGYEVPYGYPRPNESARAPQPPSVISGQNRDNWTGCWARLGPGFFTDDIGRHFAVLWDQNSLASLRQDFESLTRRGSARSDYKSLGSVASGFRVQCCGVPVCDLPAEVIEGLPHGGGSNLTTEEFLCLQSFVRCKEGRGGAVCVIEGNFGVEANRAALTSDELTGLGVNRRFKLGLANVLHEFMTSKSNHGKMMMHLLHNHYKAHQATMEDDVVKERARRRAVVEESSRLLLVRTPATPEWLEAACMIEFVPVGPEKYERQLQHLVSHFRSFALDAATKPEPAGLSEAGRNARAAWAEFRTTVHFAAGVDAEAIVKDHERGERDPIAVGGAVTERVRHVEYKWSLCLTYNHLFALTDVIVVWDLAGVAPGSIVEDRDHLTATVERDPSVEGFGFLLRTCKQPGRNDNLSDREDRSRNHQIKILSLKNLVELTFGPYCDVQLHPPKLAPQHKRPRKA